MLYENAIILDLPEEVSYIVLLEDWEIAPDKLTILDKKLGGGQFGIVRQGLLTTGKGDPEVVAVKTLKGKEKVINYETNGGIPLAKRNCKLIPFS